MQGTIVSITTDGQVAQRDVTSADILPIVNGIVGGWIEDIPLFSTYLVDGKKVDCVAFCNEEGKLLGLPINVTTTKLWYEHLAPLCKYDLNDVLVGDIAVVFGDKEFMKSL